jgi:hypothetical protein
MTRTNAAVVQISCIIISGISNQSIHLKMDTKQITIIHMIGDPYKGWNNKLLHIISSLVSLAYDCAVTMEHPHHLT